VRLPNQAISSGERALGDCQERPEITAAAIRVWQKINRDY